MPILGALFAGLLRNKWTYVALIVLVSVGVAYSYAKPAYDDWKSGRDALLKKSTEMAKRIDATQKDIDAKDAAIAVLSKQIMVEREKAQQSIVKATAAEQRASSYQAQIASLRSQVSALEAARKQEAPARTLQEARDELIKLGY